MCPFLGGGTDCWAQLYMLKADGVLVYDMEQV